MLAVKCKRGKINYCRCRQRSEKTSFNRLGNRSVNKFKHCLDLDTRRERKTTPWKGHPHSDISSACKSSKGFDCTLSHLSELINIYVPCSCHISQLLWQQKGVDPRDMLRLTRTRPSSLHIKGKKNPSNLDDLDFWSCHPSLVWIIRRTSILHVLCFVLLVANGKKTVLLNPVMLQAFCTRSSIAASQKIQKNLLSYQTDFEAQREHQWDEASKVWEMKIELVAKFLRCQQSASHWKYKQSSAKTLQQWRKNIHLKIFCRIWRHERTTKFFQVQNSILRSSG